MLPFGQTERCLGFRPRTITHRDYALRGAVHVRLSGDTLTISNPGGFVEGVTLNNLLTTEPRPRNPALADALKRTNIHHTLKKKPLCFDDLKDFVACYKPLNRFERAETWHETENPEGRWRKFAYAQIVARDKTSLDIFWLKDKSLADLDKLPDPDELAGEIIDNLEAGLNSFRGVLAAL